MVFGNKLHTMVILEKILHQLEQLMMKPEMLLYQQKVLIAGLLMKILVVMIHQYQNQQILRHLCGNGMKKLKIGMKFQW